MTDYQITRVKEKLKLNYYLELKKENNSILSFRVLFRNELDIMIQQFYYDGVQFYGFAIDMLFLDHTDPELWKKVHEHVELWLEEIGSNIELVEFAYLGIEIPEVLKIQKNSDENQLWDKKLKGIPKIYGVVGVRTIIGCNNYLDISMKKVFRSYIDHEDIKVFRLNSIKEIKKYWSFVIKENNFKFHRFTRYGKNQEYDELYGQISDLELIYDKPEGMAFGLDITENNRDLYVSGIKTRTPSEKAIIIYLLNLYFSHKKLKILGNSIFEEVSKSKYSFVLFNSLDFLKKRKIEILEYLISKYPQQLNGLKILEIVTSCWDDVINEIIINNYYLPDITFDYNAVEYQNGIFLEKENKFLSFEFSMNEIISVLENKKIPIYLDKCFF